ncbi:unnamed protein product [Thlaspi arvense]|uniref:Acid phosphatase 1 n=1 Tax=Thlaspi arvense TaxID=13288 RepID=A0AAU9T4R5_THLAR|nr:unnamed protein product [Thlaspi arvense]
MAFSRSSSVSFFTFLLFAVFINPAISSRVSSFITLPVAVDEFLLSFTASYCESWRLSVETNNAGPSEVVPSKCVRSLETYYNQGQFDNDYSIVATYTLAYAKTVKIGGDGKDAWVFDIDETLLSNLEYYAAHGYGSEPYNSKAFNEWVLKGTAPGFDASLKLFKDLKQLGFTIILLTGRDEGQRAITEKNLQDAGLGVDCFCACDLGLLILTHWGEEDQGKAAAKYKSEQRSRMVKKGYKLHGNTGDQWSDLQGFALADRSFKVPNPMYYIG